MTKRISIAQEGDNIIPTEVLASSIISIADGIRKLRSGPLNDRALFLLIQNAAPRPGGAHSRALSISTIKAVFDGIDSLEETYLKKPKQGAPR